MSSTITGIQFGITSPDEIRRRSVVEVVTDKTHQGSNPVEGGIFDSRLGVIESGKICPTCKHTNLQCQGHFGHITLTRPVYLYQFLDYLIKTLNCVCLNCSGLIVVNDGNEDEYLTSELRGMDRLAKIRQDTVSFISKLKKDIVCPKCGSELMKKIEKRQGTVCTLQGVRKDSDDPVILPSELVLRCLERLADKDIRILGFDPQYSHPAWMVCTVLAVPPLTVRPPVVMDDNQRMDDDLSHKLIDIVRSNQKLRDQIDKGQSRDYIEQHTALLEFHVATYVDNDIKGMPPAAQRSGRPLKTLKSRLGAKTGRVRGNLMGKRVDFSARSVITPDANIDVDELGVPEEIARNLTKPETVTSYNRDRLMMYVRNGAKYPGAKSVYLKEEKKTISLRYVNPDMIELREGDIVHRHMIDGDRVLFNRQPSLHKGSMECHRVKVLPYSTFRLNVSATKPYNADFDGDEMNLHLPQSIAAETELERLASVLRLIISPRENAPIIQMVQDTLTGAFRISNPKISIPEHVAMNLVSRLKRSVGSFERKNGNHTGMDVISTVFPLMNFDERVTIKNGKLVKGLLKKGAFNTPSQGVLHVLYNDFGPERCGQFINEVQSIVTKFNMFTGFSTGSSDLISNIETAEFVAETLAEGRRRVQEIITDVHAGRFVNISGRTDGDELENQINNTLKDISAKISARVMESLPKENRLVQMVEAGAKGSDLNITQMIALLGQQIIDGKRVQFTLQDRTLPHFTKFDDGIEARGFVESSFVHGLRPAEFFFHAMGGREGLIDTAVKTSDTGYIQRRMMKTMEDMRVTYDSTVRNNQGQIIQYRYGEDGIDAICVESQPIDLALLTIEEIYRRYALNPEELTPILVTPVSEAPDLVDQILSDRNMLVNDVFNYVNKDSILAPVHLKRLVNRYKNEYSTKTDLVPSYVVDELSKLIKEPYMIHNRVFHCLLRFYLAPRRCIVEYRFSKEIFDEILREIRFRYIKSRVHPGEMVGALAAQSIGEPTTQLTLNSVDWDEEIVISKNGNILISKIGEFVDNMMNIGAPTKLDNDQLYLELQDGNDWKALSCDKNGHMVWTTLEAITSHPVVNEDGSDTILEVYLQSGRCVKATKGKSFLTLVNGELVATNGSDLVVGSELPISISTSMSSLPVISHLSLRDILSPNEYMYGTDVHRALEIMKTDKHWWSNHQGKDFTLPYTRGDSFRDAFVNGKNKHKIISGFVYPKHQSCEPSQIPDTIQLTNEFGFFVGAYIAEGSSNRNQVNITNNNIDYLNRIRNLMDSLEIGTHVVNTQKIIEKTGISGRSQSLIIHSTVLAGVMSRLFGRRSYDKTFPDWCLQAPAVFQQGLIDGYISGDGCVHTDGSITFTSVSKELIERMNLLFAGHGIFTRVTSRIPENTKFQTVHEYYTSTIPQYFAQIFASKFTLSVPHKQERLVVRNRSFKRTIINDVVLDKVLSIKEVCPIKGRVYDLTVQGTRNFTTKTLINMRDTFHSAGTVKAGATQGVPRIQELLSVSRNPKNPLNYVYLNPTIAENEDQAIMMMREIQKTTLRDITRSVRMYYDPYPLSPENTVVQEDREILETYQAFSVGKDACASNWIIRLDFDKVEMASRNILDMVAIQDAIGNSGIPIFSCVYTDTNAEKLMMRITFNPGVIKNLLSLRFLEDKLLDVVIGGVEGVGRVYRREVKKELVWDENTHGYACRKQYVLDVEGTNLYGLLSFHDVDSTRTFSNDIHEVLDVFGIEAARQAIYDEFSEVFAAAYVNYHHMSVLLDSMTYQGRLVSVDRFGMSKHDNGVLAKSSFEETSKILFNAAVSAEFDAMKGISANIMFGQKPPCGTGLVEVLLDETKLPDGEEQTYIDYREQIKLRVEERKAEPEGECKIEDITMW
ncbi:DNA-directed RNA polymerase subunit A' [bacterium]|nr:DNA-directed RNA polymerase subunit A' [Actinomycetota bacterium]NDG30333.1 DNA-directed RNA polymerase subunit A' [bacterium]